MGLLSLSDDEFLARMLAEQAARERREQQRWERQVVAHRRRTERQCAAALHRVGRGRTPILVIGSQQPGFGTRARVHIERSPDDEFVERQDAYGVKYCGF